MTYEAITPLKLYGDDDGCGSIFVATADNSDLCEFYFSEIHTVNQSRDEALATARLMVAAPGLLTALQSLIVSQTPEAITQAKAAIAVATRGVRHV